LRISPFKDLHSKNKEAGKVLKNTISQTKTLLNAKLLASDRDAWAVWQTSSHSIVEVSRGRRRKLRQPVLVKIKVQWTEADLHLVKHIVESLSARMSRLISFALKQQSVFRVARHLKRSHSGSQSSLFVITYDLYRFFEWINSTPDNYLNTLLQQSGKPNYAALKTFKHKLEDFIDTLQARKQAPKGIRRQFSSIKTWMDVNDIPRFHVDLPQKIVVYHDRSPSPEEIQKLLQVANPREKVAITLIALGGFRPETLSLLRVSHVSQDFESGTIPLHVHVEEAVTKGRYGDFDTFLAKEAFDFLSLYFQLRRQGTKYIKPEMILKPESPLLRAHTSLIRPITADQLKNSIRDCFIRSGLVKKGPKRRELRVYSLRKYFNTNLAAAGVHRDYIDYMMGHVTPTYNSVKSKGIDFLRHIYQASSLSIQQKSKSSKMDVLKELVRSFGYDPDRVLVQSAMQPHKTVIGPEDTLQKILREAILNAKDNTHRT